MINKPQTDQQPENVELLSAQAPVTSFRGLVIAIVATIISAVLYQILPYDENVNKGLTILAFVAIMWFTEAVHITVTALIVPLFAILFKVPEWARSKHWQDFRPDYLCLFRRIRVGYCAAHAEAGSENRHLADFPFAR